MNTQFASPGEIIKLNVGGKSFSTSKQTLAWIPDSFFSSLLSGRISSVQDENGAIFIDRDPTLFVPILNYLRTKDVDLMGVNIKSLHHEAEFYGIAPLVKQLSLCQDLETSSCGDVLFHGCLPPPAFPPRDLSRNSSFGEADPRASRQRSKIKTREVSHPRAMSASEVEDANREPPLDDLDMPVGVDSIDPRKVTMITSHQNWIAVAFAHFVCCYRIKENTGSGWQQVFTTPLLDSLVERLALNAKVIGVNQGDNKEKMVAVAFGSHIRLWCCQDDNVRNEIGTFSLGVPVDALFFIGSQLVATSRRGRIGVWHAVTQNYQVQEVQAITSHDTAGSFLLLGCSNGSINYIDMQKFPLRMKDNDILVTELYKDPSNEAITALSVYLTPKTSLSGNWIEIAYGTIAGTVRVIVQHPETVGHGPQLFQTFTVHRNPVTKVMLSEKHLISVCSEFNHVRTWNVTRFRGMISTQPGSTPRASFKIVSLESTEPHRCYTAGNDVGPFGERDDQQVFIHKVVPETDQLYVRLAANGQRVCLIRSVDGTNITSFCVGECESSSRMGCRSRRFIFTGHTSGSIQIWDLTTALEQPAMEPGLGGPTEKELIGSLRQCELSTSRCTTPSMSPASSMLTQRFRNSYTASSLSSANPSLEDLASGGAGGGEPAANKLKITPC